MRSHLQAFILLVGGRKALDRIKLRFLKRGFEKIDTLQQGTFASISSTNKGSKGCVDIIAHVRKA